VCRAQKYLAEKGYTGGGPTGNPEPHDYNLWDAEKIYACECDEGYYWSDCSLRRCPYGNDPLFSPDDYTRTYPTQLVRFKPKTSAGIILGKNALTNQNTQTSLVFDMVSAAGSDFKGDLLKNANIAAVYFEIGSGATLMDQTGWDEGYRVYLSLTSTGPDIAEALGAAMNRHMKFPSLNTLEVVITDSSDDTIVCKTLGDCDGNSANARDATREVKVTVKKLQRGKFEVGDNAVNSDTDLKLVYELVSANLYHLGTDDLVIDAVAHNGGTKATDKVEAVEWQDDQAVGGYASGTVSLTVFDPRGRGHLMTFGLDDFADDGLGCGDLDKSTDQCGDCGVRAALGKVIAEVPEFIGATVTCFADYKGTEKSVYVYLEFPNYFGPLEDPKCEDDLFSYMDTRAAADALQVEAGAIYPRYKLYKNSAAAAWFAAHGGGEYGVDCKNVVEPTFAFEQPAQLGSLSYPPDAATLHKSNMVRARHGLSADYLLKKSTLPMTYELGDTHVFVKGQNVTGLWPGVNELSVRSRITRPDRGRMFEFSCDAPPGSADGNDGMVHIKVGENVVTVDPASTLDDLVVALNNARLPLSDWQVKDADGDVVSEIKYERFNCNIYSNPLDGSLQDDVRAACPPAICMAAGDATQKAALIVAGANANTKGTTWWIHERTQFGSGADAAGLGPLHISAPDLATALTTEDYTLEVISDFGTRGQSFDTKFGSSFTFEGAYERQIRFHGVSYPVRDVEYGGTDTDITLQTPVMFLDHTDTADVKSANNKRFSSDDIVVHTALYDDDGKIVILEGPRHECAGRGVCDSAAGECKCFKGFSKDDCSVQNALAM